MKQAIQATSISCPTCGAEELREAGKLNIRAYKVSTDGGYWWSQCLVCAGYYDGLEGEETPDNFDSSKGWF